MFKFAGVHGSHGKIVIGHFALVKTMNAASGSKQKLNSAHLLNVLPTPERQQFLVSARDIFLIVYVPLKFPPIIKISFTLSAKSEYIFIVIARFVNGEMQMNDTFFGF